MCSLLSALTWEKQNLHKKHTWRQTKFKNDAINPSRDLDIKDVSI